MAKYRVYGVISSSKYIGEFEAENKEEAEQKAWESDDAYISVCHQCSGELDDPEVTEMIIEEIYENNVKE